MNLYLVCISNGTLLLYRNCILGKFVRVNCLTGDGGGGGGGVCEEMRVLIG